MRARDHERAAGRTVLTGIGHDLAVLRLRLQVVELRDRLHRAPKHRVGRDVVHAPARDPDLTWIAAQALDEILSVARCHQQLRVPCGKLARSVCLARYTPRLLSQMSIP